MGSGVAEAKLINFSKPRVVVAIPVHNEAEYIESCLNALARQVPSCDFDVVALLNNCTDETSAIVSAAASRMPFRLHTFQYWLNPMASNAGAARRLAVRHAAKLAGEGGIIFTTDADGRVATNWIAVNLAAIEAGADAVAGMAELDAEDAATIPIQLHLDEEKSETFGDLLDEIDWLLDPDPSDPWPRHTQHSGASIAVRANWLVRAGGIPAVPIGEDRRLFTALRELDARIRHARDAIVTVSGRTTGRAKGGMADTIARRMKEPDQWLDDCLEPAADHARRATLRARAREIWAEKIPAIGMAEALRLPLATTQSALRKASFGRAWSCLERSSPVLRRRMVPIGHLERETSAARAIVEDIRRAGCFNGPIYRADSVSFASARQPEAVAVPAE
jgi:GT2 family glycosyltransferase